MKMFIKTFDYNKVYFVRVNNETTIRKMILSNEELIYKSSSVLKRTFTIAGIGEVIIYYNYKGNKTLVNGEVNDRFTFETYENLNGKSLESQHIDFDKYEEKRFAKLNGIEYRTTDYGIDYMFLYKWDGMNAVKYKVYLFNLLRDATYSMIMPTFNDETLKELGYYLTKEKCENDNVIEVIDFSY